MNYYRAILGYGHSKNILSGNAFEVKGFIQTLESQQIQNKLGHEEFRRRFRDFDGHAVRYLHNFMASVMTLVSHTRVLMRSDFIRPEHRQRYEAKIKSHFGSSQLAQFMQRFRNYCLHYGVPSTLHQTTLMPEEKYEVLLDMEKLKTWGEWGKTATEFISQQPPRVRIMDLVIAYEQLAMNFNTWFVLDFSNEYRKELSELQALQDEWNSRLKNE